jgi:hypothetical protein
MFTNHEIVSSTIFRGSRRSSSHDALVKQVSGYLPN